MKNFVLIITLSLFITTCKTQVEYVNCKKEVLNYTGFSYELSNKRIIKVVSGDTIYSANALIKISKTSGSYILMDSIYCYILAISNKESLAMGRFVKDEESFRLLNEQNLLEFELNKMRAEINDERISQKIFNSLIGNLFIPELDNEWRKNLNSDNILTMGFKQITPENGKFLKRIYQID